MFSQQMAQALLQCFLNRWQRHSYNVFSTDGKGALTMFSQQMAQALLAGADVLDR
jgi:hypothetical protein